ncbi:YraN family protein [Leucobacter salsicius]|uniref:YraN family protein n=1 Tax=Leucobacter salsicius TaxID=664638 RepID=UPI00034CE727|nr:YraN family protein [Leucobacter salsicius]
MNQSKPASHNRTVGARGEAIAAAYLEGLGFHVLDRNWHSRYGELDLVVVDEGTLVAVEVKTRTGLGYGHPLQAITQRKADRLRRLLLDWCRSSEANATGFADDTGQPARPWWERLRVDAIGIVLRPGASPSIDHLRGIS